MTCLIRLGVTLLVQIHIQLLPDSEALLHLIISSSRLLCLCFHHHILPFPPIFFSDCSPQAIYFFFFSFVLFKKSSHHRLLCSEAHLPSPSFYLEGKMTFRPREAFLTKEVPSILFPSLKPQALLPPFSVLVLYICMYGEQLRRWLVGGRMSLIQRQAEIHNLWRGKKSCLLCLVSYVKANIYFTPLDHTRRSSHA